MKTILIAFALIPALLLTGFNKTPAFQKPAGPPAKPNLEAIYNQHKDVTTIYIPWIVMWSNRTPSQFEHAKMTIGFESPKTKIVRPEKVLFNFSARSENRVSFSELDFSVSIDDSLVKLGKLKGDRRTQIHPTLMLVYDDESISISYDDFTRMTAANNVAIFIGKRKFEIPAFYLNWMRELQKVMQREGEDIKKLTL